MLNKPTDFQTLLGPDVGNLYWKIDLAAGKPVSPSRKGLPAHQGLHGSMAAVFSDQRLVLYLSSN